MTTARRRRWPWVLGLLVLLGLIAIHRALAAAPNDPSAGVLSGGRLRTYRIHVPPSYRAGDPVALVLAFHGRLGTGRAMAHVTNFDAAADAHGFIVVYPNGVDRSWNDGLSTPAEKAGVDDVAFVQRLIVSLETRYSIDPRRIYATGLSNGAMFTELLGCRLAGTLAAIAPVAGPLPTPDVAGCHPPAALPVLIVHGTSDPYVPYDGGEVQSGVGTVISAPATFAKWSGLNGCSGPARSRPLPPRTDDGTSITVSDEAGCPADVAVRLYTVVGGGHTWPGGWQYAPKLLIGKTSDQMDATNVIWSFFASHPRR